MTREGTRPLAALVVAVLAVAFLAACGGSGSDTSNTTTSEASGSTATDTAPQTGESQGGSFQGTAKKSGSQGQSKQVQAQQDAGGSGRKNVDTPLKVSGGGSAQFRTKGGDNSIQEFGDESDESELREAAEVVHAFYVAQAEEEWAKACSYLAKSNVEQLEKLGSQSPQLKNAGCAPVLAAFTQPLAAAAERRITTVDAGSLRHEGEQGFLIYFGDERVKYAMPLRNEGGAWKVAALSGTTLG